MELEEETGPEEQLPMEVVLHEIRQMLLSDIEGHVSSDIIPDLPVQKSEEPDYFLLTPAMRYDISAPASTMVLSASVQEKTQQVLHKLSRIQEDKSLKENNPVVINTTDSNTQLESAVTAWLDQKLPEMLERIVARELQNALHKK